MTYAMNRMDKRWYCYDDSRVTPIDENKVIKNTAYMLFYVRRGFDESSILPPELAAKAGMELDAARRKLLAQNDEHPPCPWCHVM